MDGLHMKSVTIAWAKQLMKEGLTIWKSQDGMVIPLTSKDFYRKKPYELLTVYM